MFGHSSPGEKSYEATVRGVVVKAGKYQGTIYRMITAYLHTILEKTKKANKFFMEGCFLED